MDLVSPKKMSLPRFQRDNHCNAVRIKTGRWEMFEKRAFLEGLRRYGHGKWKKISLLIPTRTPVQVKTHAQVILKKLVSGTKICDYLLDKNDSIDTLQLTNHETDNNLSNDVPSKLIHMTPNDKDIDAAHILAHMRILCSLSLAR